MNSLVESKLGLTDDDLIQAIEDGKGLHLDGRKTAIPSEMLIINGENYLVNYGLLLFPGDDKTIVIPALFKIGSENEAG